MKRLGRLCCGGVMGLVCLAGACTGSHSWMSHIIAMAPNGRRTIDPANDPTAKQLRRWGVAQQFRVDVPAPAASLSVWVLEPAVARATVLVLHGVHQRKQAMLRVGRALADDGYRVVLVDLRGHGRSSGMRLTYGVQEACDMVAVVDALEERGLLTGLLGVYGYSYGAATAIQLAGIDSRVQSVVAVAPFSSMQTEVRYCVRGMLFVPPWMVSEMAVTNSIAQAGNLADFDPMSADTCTAIQQTCAPVLLIHGHGDRIIPFSQSRQLHEAASDHSELLVVPWEGHHSIRFDRRHIVWQATREWFACWLQGNNGAT